MMGEKKDKVVNRYDKRRDKSGAANNDISVVPTQGDILVITLLEINYCCIIIYNTIIIVFSLLSSVGLKSEM